MSADAVVVLGGRLDRVPVGLALARRGEAPVFLVFNVHGTVDHEIGDVEVIALRPDPPTTRGEARMVGALARERGWSSIVVVSSSYHLFSRASDLSACVRRRAADGARPAEPLAPAARRRCGVRQARVRVDAEAHAVSERTFADLLADARADDDVLGLFVFGSRGRGIGIDERSDWDVAVIVRDDAALERFDARWPYEHGARIEVASATFEQLREHAAIGSDREWARYQYAHVEVLLDRTGGALTEVVNGKESIPEELLRDFTAAALGGYINATYRSLRYGETGLAVGARLDAAESIPYALGMVFAFAGRIRPFNKYLEWELEHHPLEDDAWSRERLVPRLAAVLDGSAVEQRALFRDVERVARDHGFAAELDEWEPDLAWLRGEAEYRAG